MPLPSRRLIFGAVAAQIAPVTNATGYYGQIGRAIVLPAPAGWLPDPPPKSVDDPRVKPYYLLYPGAGGDGPDTPVTGGDDGLTIGFGIQVAGGDADDVEALVDRLEARVLGWIPTVAGIVFGPIRRQPGYQPQMQTDDTKQPERLYVPLRYVLTATT